MELLFTHFLSTILKHCWHNHYNIVNNTANLRDIGIVHSTALIKANIIFSGNIDSFFVYSGEVSIIPFYDGRVIFTRNYQ